MADNINELRRELLGQIAVMRRRLDVLEGTLIDDPEVAQGKAHPAFHEKKVDAIGNLSFQAGILVGIAGKYKDAL